MKKKYYSRRDFTGYCLSAILAPEVSAQSLLLRMPTLYGDGKHDDAPALQAILNGMPYSVFREKGEILSFTLVESSSRFILNGGHFLISRELFIRDRKFQIENSNFHVPHENWIYAKSGSEGLIKNCIFHVGLELPEIRRFCKINEYQS